ncbi:MAG: PilZ domain-containing protein [Acidobacteriia bacterium]|nr:PilZ domain-containing protein [Terriglobia bacterium]
MVWEFLRGKKGGRQDRASRVPVDIPIHFREAGEFGWSVGKIKNLSRSGVLFRAGQRIAINTPLEMQFNAPPEVGPVPGELVVARGKIVRTLMPAASDQFPSFAARFSAYSVVRKSKNW